MKKLYILVALFLLLLILLPAWGFESLEVDGRERRYLLSVPDPMPETVKLLLVFHGGGGSARQASRLGERTRAVRGFVVVYPDGDGRRWNDGREFEGDLADDVSYIEALLDHLETVFPVEPGRVYATGASNGAMMSHRLGIELSSRFAAIAPMIGGIPLPLAPDFAPSHPLSVLIVQGTEDPLVPYSGGPITLPNRTRPGIVSTDRAIELWTAHNGCRYLGQEKLPDLSDDLCTVEKFSWGKGRRNSEVILYKVIGGGHTVPGGVQYLPERVIGRVCRDFDAIEVVREFFLRH